MRIAITETKQGCKTFVEAIGVHSYWEALGVLVAHRAGIDPNSLRAAASSLTVSRKPVTQPNNPELEPLTRTQILIVMGVTALLLLAVAKAWQYLGAVPLLPLHFTADAWLVGMALAAGIIAASSIIYRLWPAYRRSADTYLELVLKPLAWPDLIWLGLLPGLSEELLFRGIILPAFGLNLVAAIASSLLFGILHFSGVQQWPYVVWATVVGFVLSYSVLLTGNLLVPIIAHVLINFISSSLWKSNYLKIRN